MGVHWWILLIGIAILLIVLIWLAVKSAENRRNRRLNRESAEGTRELYAREDQRRREGTDEL